MAADIASLSADIKELRRLIANEDNFSKELNRVFSYGIDKNKEAVKALEKRVVDLEKKQKK